LLLIWFRDRKKLIAESANDQPQWHDHKRSLSSGICQCRLEMQFAVRKIEDQLAALENRPWRFIADIE
jgi:hypothetical protein